MASLLFFFCCASSAEQATFCRTFCLSVHVVCGTKHLNPLGCVSVSCFSAVIARKSRVLCLPRSAPPCEHGRCCAQIHTASFQGTCNAGCTQQAGRSVPSVSCTYLSQTLSNRQGVVAGAPYQKSAVRNHRGGAERALRAFWQIGTEQTQCRS